MEAFFYSNQLDLFLFGNCTLKKVSLIYQYFRMRKIALFFLFWVSFIHAQNENSFVDDKYLEDQIYINLTYIKLTELPTPISQTGFSYGIGFGAIKDLPFNERRNFGVGIGLGYGLNVYYFNVYYDNIISPSNDTSSNELKSNKISMHTVELPFELRFRTSTAEKYKFWRFYSGLKLAYVFATNSNLKQSEDFEVENVIEISKLNYGLTFSAGYNKWNFHLYYGLNDLFNESDTNNYNINIQDLRLGLIFYLF